MTNTRTVLVAGASSVQFPLGSPLIALPNLLKLELESSTPAPFGMHRQPSCTQRRACPKGAVALIDRFKPDALYFICSAVYAEESVLFSIQKRWPLIYKPATSMSKLFEGPEGEPAQGASSVRGLVFRAARGAAKRVAGVAPLVPLDDAIDATVRTFRAIAAVPNLSVACRLSAGGVRDLSKTPEIRRRVDEYNKAVLTECVALGFTALDIVEEMRQAGLDYPYELDRIHGNLEARRFSARLAAAAILSDLGYTATESTHA